ncbi:MAG: ACP S-malonyltransferase [Clostridia bacterium]|nr:ACP S-malonyltransferase [Clostridia bacterium]
MSKTAFMFPGQGAQYVGMGKDFFDNSENCRKVFEKAEELTGLKISDICFEENEDINKTEFTQIALLTTECAMLEAVLEKGIKADVTLGLSLGEYGALAASNVMSMEDAFKVVRNRGIFMEQAVPAGIGAMAAVLGLDANVIEDVLSEISADNAVVEIANYNCPGQIVISGEKQAVENAAQKLKEAGAKRVVMLNVSGPFHSSMLKPAGDKLKSVLDDVEINEITIPYVANVTADYVTSKENVKELLIKQVYSSVRFEQSVRKLIEDGVDTFIEIGPGRTLCSFVKKISRDVNVINIEKYEDLSKLDLVDA